MHTGKSGENLNRIVFEDSAKVNHADVKSANDFLRQRVNATERAKLIGDIDAEINDLLKRRTQRIERIKHSEEFRSKTVIVDDQLGVGRDVAREVGINGRLCDISGRIRLHCHCLVAQDNRHIHDQIALVDCREADADCAGGRLRVGEI
jgi:hypothetical protein